MSYRKFEMSHDKYPGGPGNAPANAPGSLCSHLAKNVPDNCFNISGRKTFRRPETFHRSFSTLRLPRRLILHHNVFLHYLYIYIYIEIYRKEKKNIYICVRANPLVCPPQPCSFNMLVCFPQVGVRI